MTDTRQETIDALTEEGYARNSVEQIADWCDMVLVLLILDRERHLPILKDAVSNLTTKAESLYADLQSGKPVKMNVADLGSDWLAFEQIAFADRFLDLTGTILFAGIDGPRATSSVLLTKLDQIAEWCERNPDACIAGQAAASEALEQEGISRGD